MSSALPCSRPRASWTNAPINPARRSSCGGVADPELWATLSKIKRAVECPDSLLPSYHGQLLRLLAAELALRHGSAASPKVLSRGGLSGRHARLVKDHLDEHFARAVPLDRPKSYARMRLLDTTALHRTGLEFGAGKATRRFQQERAD